MVGGFGPVQVRLSKRELPLTEGQAGQWLKYLHSKLRVLELGVPGVGLGQVQQSPCGAPGHEAYAAMQQLLFT